jgi:hypothetical protein
MDRRAAPLRRHARGDPLVDPAVELVLDPVEEAGDQLVVVRRPELPPRSQGHLELVFRRRFDVQNLTDKPASRQGRPVI